MPILIQRHSPSSLNARIAKGLDNLIIAIDKKNAEDPGWQEREAEERRQKALAGEHHESTKMLGRIFHSMATMVNAL